MTSPKNAANGADRRKRYLSREAQHNARRSKRLRQESPEPRARTSERPFARRRVKATRPTSVPSLPVASDGSSKSTSAKPAHTTPLVIDLTGDDDEEDTVMESAPWSAKHIQPDADVAQSQQDGNTALSRPGIGSPRPQPVGDASSPRPGTDTPRRVSACQRDDNNGVPYDACFGLIKMPAMISRYDKDSDCFPVKVRPSDVGLMISTVGSAKHLGLASGGLASRGSWPAVRRLVESSVIFLTGMIEVLDNRRRLQYVEATLRVVVYGFMSKKQTVAKTLSDNDLYLQHPSLSECDCRVPYFNPQYLLPPGGSMPALEDLKISGPGGVARGGADTLTEVEKSRLLQMFESAQGPNATSGVCVSPRLRSVPKAHQISALAMMMEKECGVINDATFPSIWKPDEDGKGYTHVVTREREDDHPRLLRGGILADEMGLGKTLSAITLILWHADSLESSKSRTQLRTTLIVTPKSTIPGWNQQFDEHVKPGRISVRTYHGSNRHQVAKTWDDADVVLTTYDTLKSDKASGGPLVKVKWARVILDEAHSIRNRDTKVFRAAEAIRAPCRWCMTGTPIQNSIDDLGALITFIKVPSLADQSQFNGWIAAPIKDRKPFGFTRLRDLIRATCLRRTKANAGGNLELPKKEEVNKVLDLDPRDRELYDFFRQQATAVALRIERRARLKAPGMSRLMRGWGDGGGSDILPLIGHLRRICDHGEDLLPPTAVRAWRERDAESVAQQLMTLGPQRCDACEAELSEDSDDMVTELTCGHIICANCFATQGASDTQASRASCPKCDRRSPLQTPSQNGLSREYRPSVKVRSLVQSLRSELSVRPASEDGKVFKSCWTRMLDFVQAALQEEKICFRRIDGRTTLTGRENTLRTFGNDPDCRVLLASIGSMGEGVNLTVANHVHILEPHWNPMVEAQAVDRVHRIGQRRDVLITRYLIKDSIEFYVRGVQQDKLRLIHQSLSSSEIKQKDVDGQRFKKLLESLK